MAFKLVDRVQQVATTTGTGTFTLSGTVAGMQTFTSVLSNGDTTHYLAADAIANTWEVGLGTFATSGTTLARTTILQSSNSGSAVSFANVPTVSIIASAEFLTTSLPQVTTAGIPFSNGSTTWGAVTAGAGLAYSAGTLSTTIAQTRGGVKSGRYYFGVSPVTAGAAAVQLTSGVICWAPTTIASPVTITDLGAYIEVAQTSSNVQLAIYASANGAPTGAPIYSSGSLATTSTGRTPTTGISQSVAAGFYWFGMIANGTTLPSMLFVTEQDWVGIFGFDIVPGAAGTPALVPVTAGATFGTWPSNPTITYVNTLSQYPCIWWRF